MEIRLVTSADVAVVEELLGRLAAEVPHAEHAPGDEEARRRRATAHAHEHVALLAEREGAPAGLVLAHVQDGARGFVSDAYVVPEARRSGVAAALLREATAELRRRGAAVVALEVASSNVDARAVCERLGFRETRVRYEAAAAELEQRLSRAPAEPSHGLVFVQSDDEPRVQHAVRAFLPRLGRSAWTEVRTPNNGWIAVEDELCSADPALLRRLAQELSYRTGGVVLALGVEESAVVRYVLFDRGSVADEYASLPEHHGPLPPGDVVGLSANPTVAHRLTNADPDRVRAVARTAAAPSELPPPAELMAEIADVLGVPLP